MKIVQCWDDGVVDDVRLIDILRKYGAKASFNLNFGTHQTTRYLS
jgi:peptidoglycan-N-acetylglucosamine deacetylase